MTKNSEGFVWHMRTLSLKQEVARSGWQRLHHVANLNDDGVGPAWMEEAPHRHTVWVFDDLGDVSEWDVIGVPIRRQVDGEEIGMYGNEAHGVNLSWVLNIDTDF